MNTAGRLLSIYDRLMSHSRGKDTSMVKVWADVFDLPSGGPNVEDDVVTCLQAMRSEMELLRSKLAAIGASEELLQPGLARLRNITSTAYINSGWNSLWPEASPPENRVPLMWASWTLRAEDENDMPADELAVLRTELDSLEASIRDAEMAPFLRSFIQRQIEAIRSALRVYRVQGVKPIEEALHKVAGSFTVEKTRVESEHAQATDSAKSLFSRTGEIIKKTAELADRLDKIKKGADNAYLLATTVGPLFLTWAQK